MLRRKASLWWCRAGNETACSSVVYMMTATPVFTGDTLVRPNVVTPSAPDTRPAKLWLPKRVVFTPDALNEPFGQQIYERVSALGLPIEVMKNNRITGLRGADDRETYRIAKNTLAIVKAPPGAFRLQPIPPSADWQMNLAEGCPAHCQYCYLAGSLAGPPVVRVYANLPAMLDNTVNYEQPGKVTTFEVSCYTDVIGIEHLTGSLGECIRHFGTRPDAQLRFVTKYNEVDSLLDLPHNGRTRARVSLNAESVARRLEGGTASVTARLGALRRFAQAGYPLGVVVAPIMPIPNWHEAYTDLLDRVADSLHDITGPVDLTAEFISHRFTPGSKDVLTGWYPNTSLEMDETSRAEKRNKFGGTKYVYRPDDMKTLKQFFYTEWTKRFPNAPVLYWT